MSATEDGLVELIREYGRERYEEGVRDGAPGGPEWLHLVGRISADGKSIEIAPVAMGSGFSRYPVGDLPLTPGAFVRVIVETTGKPPKPSVGDL